MSCSANWFERNRRNHDQVRVIERLASQQPHIPAKAVEDAVKEMLEHMASTLAQGEREIRGFGSFLCTIVLHVPGVTRKLAIKSSWKASTFHTLSRVKNCAIAPIFTATEFSQPVKLGSRKHLRVLFCLCRFPSEGAPHFSVSFSANR